MPEIRLMLFVPAVPLLGAGACTTMLMIRCMNLAQKSLRWPSTEGRILSVDVDAGTGKTKAGFLPKVEYEYFVKGTRYTGGPISFCQHSENSRKKAQRLVAKYQENTEVEIYYDPRKPKRSVLHPGFHGKQHVRWGTYSVLLSVAGLASIVFSFVT